MSTPNTPTPTACLITLGEDRERLRAVASAYEISGHALGEICAHAGRAYPTRGEISNAAPGHSEAVQRATLARAILRSAAALR